MSETDSFIDEVSEEVRKDKLYATIRKYGWLAVVIVLALVGGTAFREYKIASANKVAQKTGDAISKAISLEGPEARAAALSEIIANDKNVAIIALLKAAEQEAGGEFAASVETLEALAASKLPSAYRELAHFKKLLIEKDGLNEDARIAGLNELAASASPYALYAKEQLSLIDLAKGRKEAAINRLSQILEDANLSQSLRQRVSQLMIILGQMPETSER